jgi:hypothetical protein
MSEVALGIAAVALAAAHASPVSKPPRCSGPYPVGWLCDETDYLVNLGRDGVTVQDHGGRGERRLPGLPRLHRPQ